MRLDKHTNSRSIRNCTLFCTAMFGLCLTLHPVNAYARDLPHKVVLQPGMVIGGQVFPNGDTSKGGQGQHVRGIQADVGANVLYHIHVHLSLFHNGRQVAVPKEIGILRLHLKNDKGSIVTVIAYYWLHTHDETGIIHVESPVPASKMKFTLGDFFDIWGEPLNTHRLATWHGRVVSFVEEKLHHGNPANILLQPQEQITLEIGSRVVTPPQYAFPPGY